MLLKNNIGVKVYLDSEIDLNKYNNRPLEISFFDKENIEHHPFLIDILNQNYTTLIYHANYNKFCLKKYLDNTENLKFLLDEVNIALKIKANKMVMHLDQSSPILVNKNETRYNHLISKIICIFEELYLKQPKAKDVSICIENTFASKEFYRDVILTLNNKGFNVGFTFDFGHAKIWSSNTFNDWISISKEFYYKDIPTHFHVHKNNGLYDQHKSIFLDLKDYRTDYSQDIIKELLKYSLLFENSTFILETQTEIALKDIINNKL
jgi:hypothetical protein